MKKRVILIPSIFIIGWLCFMVFSVRYAIVNYKNEYAPYRDSIRVLYQNPYIYHLHDAYSTTYYVYPNFQDDYRFIKYMLDFANEHPGTIHILTNENDVYFERKLDYPNESIRKRHHFFFARKDSCDVNYEFIVVDYRGNKVVDFQIETVQFENGIGGRKLKADFKDVNVNIIQEFLDYTSRKDYEFRNEFHSCIYELYDQSYRLILRQIYTGKYFTIEMY